MNGGYVVTEFRMNGCNVADGVGSGRNEGRSGGRGGGGDVVS